MSGLYGIHTCLRMLPFLKSEFLRGLLTDIVSLETPRRLPFMVPSPKHLGGKFSD